MGCPDKVRLGDDLVFGICTHDPDTGVLTGIEDVWDNGTSRAHGFAGSSISAVAYNGSNMWVAVGAGGKLASSPDAVTWTHRTSQFGAALISNVAHDQSGLWVAVGNVSDKLSTSTDGINWTQRSGTGMATGYGVTYGGGIWVVTGSAGSIVTSTDGTTWTSRTSGFGSDTIYGVAYNGSDLFIAVGGSGKVATSPDGITWTQRTTGLGSISWQDVAHDQSGLWVAVGSSATIGTSADGITWTSRTSTRLVHSRVAYNGSNMWVIGVGSPSDVVVVSIDGTDWAEQAVSLGSGVGAVVYADSTWIIAGSGDLVTYTGSSWGTRYRIYEDEVATPVTTGALTALDSGNTTGFYVELISCLPSNGYQEGKTYTVYIEATVDGDTGGITYAFKVVSSLVIPYFRGRSSVMTAFEKDSKIITSFTDRSRILTALKRDSKIPT